jgi:hypothetical protein
MTHRLSRIALLIIVLAAFLLTLVGAVHAGPLYQEEDTPTFTPTSTPTETPAPTITPLYVYDRTISAGEIFQINATVLVGLAVIALLIAIVALLIFRKRG